MLSFTSSCSRASIFLIYMNVLAIKADFNEIFEHAKFKICVCSIKACLIPLCLIAELKTAVKMKSAVTFCAGM